MARPPTRPEALDEAVTLIAYGSLMSGLGLASLGRLPARQARRVRLHGCRRGFGKLSRYGDRLAMVLEPIAPDAPIVAAPSSAAPDAAGVEALALTVGVADLGRVAAREGYDPAAVARLAALARDAGCGLATYLADVSARAGHECRGYRRALWTRLGYTSAHYIPHPVETENGPPAIVFLPPGPEGSGADHVVPIRVQTAMTSVLTLRQAWSVKPNADQLDYFATCVLAEVHGVRLTDVLLDLDTSPPLVAALRARVAPEAAGEAARFRAILELDDAAYAACFAPRPVILASRP